MANPRYYHATHYGTIYGAPLLSNKIRVITFLRPINPLAFADYKTSRPSENIRCRLEIVPIDEAKCMTLTYAWGDRSKLEVIEVNGANFWVTPNVYQSLLISIEYLAKETNDSPFTFANTRMWIDAVCIDQHNYEEKQSQIQLMKEVYGGADYTAIWLNEPTTDETRSNKAMSWLNRLLEGMTWDEFMESKAKRDPLWDEYGYECFISMLSQPWFERRWVIQEAALSPIPVVCYGTEAGLLWSSFIDAVDRVVLLWTERYRSLTSHRLGVSFLHPGVPMVKAIDALRNTSNGRPRLAHLLNNFNSTETSEPLDRVFSLLGLCSEEERVAKKPDYSLSVVEACRRLVYAHIRLNKDLDILCLANETAQISSRRIDDAPRDLVITPSTYLPDHPSWVPNLTSNLARWHFGPSIKSAGGKLFNASIECAAEVHNIEQLLSSRVLSITGLIVDTIAAVETHTPCIEPAERDPDSRVWQQMWTLARQSWTASSPYRNQDDLLTAFFRTIAAGAMMEKRPIAEKYLRYYCFEWFRSSELGQSFRAAGFEETELGEDHDEWDIGKPYPKELQQPTIFFNLLLTFAFATTTGGRMALVPPYTRAGDRICVLYGCSSPLLLRDAHEEWFHSTRGSVYIDGFMFGEAIQAQREGRLEKTTFHLV